VPKATPLPNNDGIGVSAPDPAPAPDSSEVAGPAVPPAPGSIQDPNAQALPSPGEIVDTLGLRGARSVSRAFGAFLGLGLILPVARFVIRRFG
jgi:hypothetical protein